MSSKCIKTWRRWQIASGCSKRTFLSDNWICFVLQMLLAVTKGQWFSEYITQACMCVDKRHDMAQGRRSLVSINRGWTLLPLMHSWQHWCADSSASLICYSGGQKMKGAQFFITHQTCYEIRGDHVINSSIATIHLELIIAPVSWQVLLWAPDHVPAFCWKLFFFYLTHIIGIMARWLGWLCHVYSLPPANHVVSYTAYYWYEPFTYLSK